ncbi:hypothetical protein HK100_004524 [Physocladia obscura]|uniref:Uncharacterized protein n=1 Tax=Physocladia obscura TaxID=109957 RepID=A0AAD5SYD0_9FUNG|nr:hypothetical protein HK100_004524 [Physocladia obscura]
MARPPASSAFVRAVNVIFGIHTTIITAGAVEAKAANENLATCDVDHLLNAVPLRFASTKQFYRHSPVTALSLTDMNTQGRCCVGVREAVANMSVATDSEGFLLQIS